MKRIVYCLLSLILLHGCQKYNTAFDSPDYRLTAPVNNLAMEADTYSNEYFVNLLLYNEAYSRQFAPVVENLAGSTLNIYSEIYSKGGMTLVNQYKSHTQTQRTCGELISFCLSHDIDTSIMMNNRAEMFANWGIFMQKCPAFLDLSDSRRLSIFTSVTTVLKDSLFRQNNSGNLLVKAYNNVLLTMKPNLPGTTGVSGRLTSEEVLGCLGSTLAGMAGNSVQLIRDFVNVINGTNLGWGGIKAVARSFFNSVVSSNALFGAVSFGICIVWEVFF